MSFFAMRKGERRDVWAAFLTLFALIASHSILETARDALFLAEVSAARLPWMFLAIAILSVGMMRLNEVTTRAMSPRRALGAVTLGTAAVTLAFAALPKSLNTLASYALYVWSGLLTGLVLVHFWEIVGRRFTITQAKRLYGFIGAGSVLGAIAGSGSASLLARELPAERLVPIAAFGLAASGLITLIFSDDERGARVAREPHVWADIVAYVRHDPYACRVVTALFLATICLTISDFIFKSATAAQVPKDDLAAFLGGVYFAVNVSSLVFQLGVVAWILKRISLGAALGVLPALLIVSGVGIASSSGLVAVILLKASDGTLRYSLHRTTTELLMLPFADEARRHVKAFAELIGQRAGQVVAALIILGFTALEGSLTTVAAALVVFAGVWLACALLLREPYLAVFRARLKAGRSNQLQEFPALDVASLTTLLATLESPNDREVLAALDNLEREGKAQLVPTLLLHHPSEPVVLSVLGILTRSRRTTAVPTLDRVMDHVSPVVRAAALAARSVLAPDTQQLARRLVTETSPEVRATIRVNLLVAGALPSGERDRALAELFQDDSLPTQLSFLAAVCARSARGFERELLALSSSRHAEVRRAAVRAMGSIGTPDLLPKIVLALADDTTRSEAEHALAPHGNAALEALLDRLKDTRAEFSLRRRIPAAMALSSPELALSRLIAWLPKELDGGVRFGILLVLERLIRQHPTLPVDRAALALSVRETLIRAYRYLDARLSLRRGAVQEPERKTPGHDLLHDLLRDKELNIRGRLFRLLGLLYPSEDFTQIYRSLTMSAEQRATSLELIESILREPIRRAVLGLVEDGPDDVRQTYGTHFYRPTTLAYTSVIERLTTDESEAVRLVALFHAQEIGLSPRSQPAGRAA